MKCKGKIIEKNKMGKNVEKLCNENINIHDMFCSRCGTATSALSNSLSAKKNFQFVYDRFKQIESQYYAFGILLFFTGFVFLALALYFSQGNYWLTNGLLLFVVPILFLPFASEENFIENPLTISSFLSSFKYYPHFWLFTLINIVFFLLMKIINTGFILNIATDPLLHFARLILVVYWIAVVFPAPLLIIRKKINPFSAIKLAYEAGKETRWQQFFTLFFVLVINAVGLALIGVGLIVSLPLSYLLIERYYRQMDEYELFSENEQ
ncbi:MAG: hypothetical protein K8S23_02210 [Candidatus Cloacimonetes bacterium]|nr:hypothetical protein [Candidatus Cloacimonadota bacterium]